MFYGRLSNRQRADNDPSFQVSITGYSRAEWSLVMQVLHEWQATTHSEAHRELIVAVKNVYQALQSHVVENSDGYQVQTQPRQLTELESVCLNSVRDRRSKELQEMEEFAMQFEAARRKSKRKPVTTNARESNEQSEPLPEASPIGKIS